MISICSWLGIIALSSFLIYVGGLGHTMGWGVNVRSIVGTAVLVLPFVILMAFLGARKAKQRVLIGSLLFVVILVVPILYAGAQEYVVQKKHDCPHAEDRWWPYGIHGLLCTEDGRWIGHD